MTDKYQLIPHRCGHTEQLPTSLDPRTFQQYAHRIRLSNCPDCQLAHIAIDNQDAGRQPIHGPRRLVQEAESIRRKTLRQAQALRTVIPVEQQPQLEELLQQIRTLTDPDWWVKHRNDALATLSRQIETF